MKIITLALSLLFISILTFEYISDTKIIEVSEKETIENILEKRIIDKNFDDKLLLSEASLCDINTENTVHLYKKSYTLSKNINSLFKPPIYI